MRKSLFAIVLAALALTACGERRALYLTPGDSAPPSPFGEPSAPSKVKPGA